MTGIKPYEIPAKQKDNLCKLASYLQSLPEDYEHFDMSRFNGDDIQLLQREHCGTSACAAGHGPYAGISPAAYYTGDGLYAIDWAKYSAREFLGRWDHTDDQSLWEWCFGGLWRRWDDHHYGAAARIRFLLENGGVPERFWTSEDGDDFVDAYSKYRNENQVPLPKKGALTKAKERLKELVS
jgi:hypothetical protein